MRCIFARVARAARDMEQCYGVLTLNLHTCGATLAGTMSCMRSIFSCNCNSIVVTAVSWPPIHLLVRFIRAGGRRHVGHYFDLCAASLVAALPPYTTFVSSRYRLTHLQYRFTPQVVHPPLCLLMRCDQPTLHCRVDMYRGFRPLCHLNWAKVRTKATASEFASYNLL